MSTIVGYLVGQVGQLSGARFAIPEGGLIIGCDPNHADLVVEHSLVSRRHARIAPGKDGKLYLIDLQSRNGTHLNGRRITAPVVLSAGDKIDFGGERKAVFVLESAESESVTGILKQAFGENFAPIKWKPGDVIGGKYEVLGTLGKGGFGVVYLVYNHEAHALCALKTFRDEFLADGNVRKAFKKEALLWVNLERHPFILSATWVQEFSGRLFVAMDYVAPDNQGRVSLAHHLAKAGGPLDPDQVLEWAVQFSLGMEHANAHGIKCHRDIKPANILITQDGTLKITDFGLAAAAEVACRKGGGIAKSLVTGSENEGFSFSAIEVDGMTRCGTLGYMPPEVFRGEPADIRGDIYSFGLVLWQMGRGSRIPPFLPPYPRDIGNFPRNVYERQMDESLPRIKRPLWPVVKRCLRAKPTKRYGDFGELRDDLAAILRKRTGRTVRVPEVSERSAAFWNNKGASLDALGRHDEAIGCFDKALEIDPRDAAAWINKGVSLDSLGRREEAIGCYDKALEIDPRDAAAWSNKGGSLNSLGRHDEAIGCFDKALEIDPRDVAAWYNKGNALGDLGRRDEAIGCYDKALEIDPRYAVAWDNKGLALHSLGRHEEAIGRYDKALQIDPRDAAAWSNKGNALVDLGRRDEAIGCFDKALEIDPRYTVAWNNKGRALHRLGRYEKAIRCYDKVLAIDPRYAVAWDNKGLALHSLGRHEEAIGCYDKALEIDPRDAAAWSNKGGSLNSLGRREEAIGCYDKALEIDPRDVAAWYNKALAEDATGESSAAVRSYRRFIELAPAQNAKQVAYARQRLEELEK
jgi:tetratricopeptide (TPR) repeat protein